MNLKESVGFFMPMRWYGEKSLKALAGDLGEVLAWIYYPSWSKRKADSWLKELFIHGQVTLDYSKDQPAQQDLTMLDGKLLSYEVRRFLYDYMEDAARTQWEEWEILGPQVNQYLANLKRILDQKLHITVEHIPWVRPEDRYVLLSTKFRPEDLPKIPKEAKRKADLRESSLLPDIQALRSILNS